MRDLIRLLRESKGEFYVYSSSKKDPIRDDSDGIMWAKGQSKDQRLFVFTTPQREDEKYGRKLVWKGQAKAQHGQTASSIALRIAAKKL